MQVDLVVGATHVYGDNHLNGVVLRSNGGSFMSDTFPTNPGMDDGQMTVYNEDTMAQLVIRADSVLDGLSTNWIMLGPKQSAEILIRDGEYRAIRKPDRCVLGEAGIRHQFLLDNVNGDDRNHGMAASAAFKTCQGAYDTVKKRFHLNHQNIEFYLKYTGVEYTPGVVCWDLLVGQSMDIGIQWRGEKLANGSLLVQIGDGINGAMHSAGGSQVYVRDLKFRSWGDAIPVSANYWGFVTMDNCAVMGCGVNAAYVKAWKTSRVEINSTLHLYGNANPAVVSGNCAFACSEDSGIVLRGGIFGHVYNDPWFTRAFAVVDNNATFVSINGWTGTARCPKFNGSYQANILTWQFTEHLPGSAPGSIDGSSSYNGISGPF